MASFKLNHLFKNPVSKYNHILRSWECQGIQFSPSQFVRPIHTVTEGKPVQSSRWELLEMPPGADSRAKRKQNAQGIIVTNAQLTHSTLLCEIIF